MAGCAVFYGARRALRGTDVAAVAICGADKLNAYAAAQGRGKICKYIFRRFRYFYARRAAFQLFQ